MEVSNGQSGPHSTPFGKSYYGAEREQVIHDLVAQTITRSEAVDALTSHIIEDKTREAHEWTWTMIVAAASTIADAKQNDLVLLVIALAARAGELSEMVEQRLKIPGYRKDLTMLERLFFNIIETVIEDLTYTRRNRSEGDDRQNTKQYVIQWTIFTSLAAVLRRTTFSRHSHISEIGIEQMSHTLAHRFEGGQITKPRWQVAGASAWVLLNGSAFYESIEEDDTQLHGEWARPLRTGRPGTRKERWALWRIQLGRIAYHDEVDEQTRCLARRAEVEMHRIE